MVSQETRLECARNQLGKLKTLEHMETWDVVRRFDVSYFSARRLLLRLRYERGEIALADVPPDVRREMIDPANLDLQAIANGPIMDSNELYLPAGKISMDEAKAREHAGVERLT